MTNIAVHNPTANAIQLRPFEVLVQVIGRSVYGASKAFRHGITQSKSMN